MTQLCAALFSIILLSGDASTDARDHLRLGNQYAEEGAKAGMLSRISLAKKAKEEWERAVALDPKLIPARFALLEFHVMAPGMMGGSESAALQQAREIRKLDSIDGHRAFARIHTAAKEMDLARIEYVAMLKEQPSSARAHYHYGVFLMLYEKNYKAATDEFEKALKLDRAYMPAYFQIGHTAALSHTNQARGQQALRKYLAYKPTEDEPSLDRAEHWLKEIAAK